MPNRFNSPRAARPPAAAPLLAAVLRQAQQALAQWPHWVHPSWWQARGLTPPGPALSPALRQAYARQLGAALDLPPLRLDTLARWDAATAAAGAASLRPGVLALLPPAPLRRVLILRALLNRRRWLRQQLNPALWQTLRGWTGAAAFQALLQDAEDPLDDIGPLPMAQRDMDVPTQLAWQGYGLGLRDGLWPAPGLQSMLRLRFAAQARLPALPPRPDLAACLWLTQRLDRWVPEWPWLSG